MIPRGCGGPNAIENCVSACRQCNGDRNRRDMLSPGHKGPAPKASTTEDLIVALGEASRQRCGVAPGTACPEVDQKRGKGHAALVHDERRQLASENSFGSVGWHTFRHTCRSLLSGADTPIDVQQKLLRHAQLSTTQQYGGPPMENQRRANTKVVRKLLRREWAG